MNKKGFTLIEVLAVLLIIAFIGLITIPKITDMINNSRAETEQANIEEIINVSKIYHLKNSNLINTEIYNNGDYNLNLSVLYSQKYLKKKTSKYDSSYVIISMSGSSEYNYTFHYIEN